MPPRKGKSSSSTKQDGEDSQPELWFEWEGDRRKWTSYTWKANAAIRDALQKGKSKTKISVGGTDFDVRLDKMVQSNCVTKWERRIRCVVSDDNGYFTWQWQDERNRWNPYLCDATKLLEASYTGDKKIVDIQAAGRDYAIDVTKMEQRNTDTDVVRKVDRLKIDYTPPEKEEEEEEEEEIGEETQPSAAGEASSSKPKGEPKSGRKRTKAETSKDEDDDQTSAKKSKSDIKTVRLTGHAPPVDPECLQMQNKSHVFMEGNDIYDAMLNQTNLANNNNKYYLLQLLEDNSKKQYHVWFRWGRVGLKGQNNLTSCGSDLEKAKEMFINKFWDKTRNEWSQRRKFQKVQGKYDLLKMDYSTDEAKQKDETDAGKKKPEKPKPDSKLDKRVQELVKLICNIQAMEDMVVEMKYDAQKAPLGKLTNQQIKAGYAALKKIEKCHQKKDFGKALVLACDEFYTRIPHNFGMQRPPIIRTRDDLKAKLTLLEALGDIQVAMTVLKAATTVDEHPIDRQYHALKCELKAVEKTHEDFKMVQEYLKNTHAPTHSHYSMEVLDLFEVDKEGEKASFKDVGNRQLLWHGSRLTNWAGILGQGLRIAPPEAPVTGYMFGKGVYFADMSSKSCNYCFATPSKNIGVALLCEVALGNANELLAADYNGDQVPKGKNSVKGLGKIAPDESAAFTMSDGTIVPLGKGMSTGISNPNGYTLNYNEFVVYNTKQIKMRYLVKVKFNFK
ncbi:Poly [ADP-ribose] polymerase 2 [Holothuria leucospilota]|uniref:Poly [ADP-ribose] polymerase n=1 Tax=Holothuria leucospilota TaxID=206669 RepID=A0A9Q1CAH8_HOLLE|nr:Poly [ADP-ribose] polymerase 2 [Holothuria leucospilota]